MSGYKRARVWSCLMDDTEGRPAWRLDQSTAHARDIKSTPEAYLPHRVRSQREQHRRRVDALRGCLLGTHHGHHPAHHLAVPGHWHRQQPTPRLLHPPTLSHPRVTPRAAHNPSLLTAATHVAVHVVVGGPAQNEGISHTLFKYNLTTVL
jgi:hypothetical protein